MRRSVLREIRDIVPIRPLTRPEALAIAERQALMLLQLLDVASPAVPERVIAELPKIEVRRVSPFPVSGATQWIDGRWVIVLNGSEPITRQRFSLAHELKHIIDHRFVYVLYAAVKQDDRPDWIEQVCDYFAGCLLMPRPWLKRAWTSETQDVGELARRFHVSQAAISTRLAQTGLAEPPARCGQPTQLTREQLIAIGRRGKYRRTPKPLRLDTTDLITVGGSQS